MKTQCKCRWHLLVAVQIKDMEKGNFALCLLVFTLTLSLESHLSPVTVEFSTNTNTTYIYMWTHTMQHTNIHMCTHTCTHTHIHTYTYTHTHTQMNPSTCIQTLDYILGGQAEYVVYVGKNKDAEKPRRAVSMVCSAATPYFIHFFQAYSSHVHELGYLRDLYPA